MINCVHLKEFLWSFTIIQCGKDQCVRESAGAKSFIHSFVDAGNVSSSEDVPKALKYGKRLRNFAAVVANIEIKSKITGTAIPPVPSFHSFDLNIMKQKLKCGDTMILEKG